MGVVGLITEYNPFHYGHKLHLEKSKLKTNSKYSIALMSGSFVQRGEPSIVDKWTKAKMAIENGVDLVIELPFSIASMSAEIFAHGAVKILNDIGIVDYLSFGTESKDLETINRISQILINEPKTYKERLKINLDLGLSYPESRANALIDYMKGNREIRWIMNQSNNILAIEYLKALKLLKSDIQAVNIIRQGGKYTERRLEGEYASATAIRLAILNNGLDYIKSYLPKESYNILGEYIDENQRFNQLSNYSYIFNYLVNIQGKTFENIMDVQEGLDNRIVKISKSYIDLESLVNKVSTKRYPKTRIQRIIIHYLMDYYYKSFNLSTKYIRVLGSNKKGFFLLNRIKNNSHLSIITRFSDHKKTLDFNCQDQILLDKKSTDLFYYGISRSIPKINQDYLKSPYIKLE